MNEVDDDDIAGMFLSLYFLLLVVIAQDKRDRPRGGHDLIVWVASAMMVFSTAVRYTEAYFTLENAKDNVKAPHNRRCARLSRLDRGRGPRAIFP